MDSYSNVHRELDALKGRSRHIQVQARIKKQAASRIFSSRDHISIQSSSIICMRPLVSSGIVSIPAAPQSISTSITTGFEFDLLHRSYRSSFLRLLPQLMN